MFVFLERGRRVIDRRRFLALGAVVAAGVVAPACDAGDTRSLSRPDLLAALGPDAVRRLGRRYRESLPRERDASRLEAAIRASRPWTARLGVAHSPIADQVREDFEAGRTVVVDGWLLSVTEARQCALYSALGS